MLIFSVVIGGMRIVPGTYQSFHKSTQVVFIIFTCMCSAGIVTSMARGKVRRGQVAVAPDPSASTIQENR